MHNQSHPSYTKGSSDNVEKKEWGEKIRTYLEKESLWILKREMELGT